MPLIWFDNSQVDRWTSTLLGIQNNLQRINNRLSKMEMMMTAVDDAVKSLETQVNANTDAEQSAIQLIQNLATLIQQNAGDPTAINNLASRLKSSADALAAAVVANTPASGEEPAPAE